MTNEELTRAQGLARKIIAATAGMPIQRSAQLLFKLLEPGLDMKDILALVPAPNVRAKAQLLGISRQAFYGLLGGNVPRPDTVARLAEATGVSEDAIRSATAHALTLRPE
jgi:hypothetical protein